MSISSFATTDIQTLEYNKDKATTRFCLYIEDGFLDSEINTTAEAAKSSI